MKKTNKSIHEREVIIAEYLLGHTTFRKLEAKHGVDFRIIHQWVSTFVVKIATLAKPQKVSCNNLTNSV